MIHNPPGQCKNWGALFSCLTVSSADTQMWRCRPWNCQGRLHIFFCCTEVEWNSLCSHQRAVCPIPDHSLCLRLKKFQTLKGNIHKWWHTNRALYILNSLWLLHTPNAGGNMLFQNFLYQKAFKKLKRRFCKAPKHWSKYTTCVVYLTNFLVAVRTQKLVETFFQPFFNLFCCLFKGVVFSLNLVCQEKLILC